METAQFLARVIPPGPYFAICYNKSPGKKGGFGTRFFPEGRFADAAGFTAWGSARGWDVYHAQASFRVASADGQDARGQPKFRGERTQANAVRLRSFWMDLDVSRPGDGKPPGAAFANAGQALSWLTKFRAAIGLPRPNLATSSGYGLHVYWVLEDALTAAEWQPHAEALKAAMLAHGFTGDAGITADAARLLRPPGTANHKTATPAPVLVLERVSAGDIPNADMLGALAKFAHLAPPGKARPAGPAGPRAAALGGGTVSPIFGNLAGAPNMNAAAALPAPPVRPHSFAKIAQGCPQVAASLADHGATDLYPLWYLGHLTLAHFCADGADYVHPISSGHPGYTPAATDHAVQQVAAEVTRKGSGPPSCAHYERCRPAVCQACPFRGQITTPWSLGVDDADLPDRYRRQNGGIEVNAQDPQTKEWSWIRFMAGDVSRPVVDWLPNGGYAMSFDYARGFLQRTVHFPMHNFPHDKSKIFALAQLQGIALVSGTEARFRSFVVAWMDKLIQQSQVRTESIEPFGWARSSGGGITGFALAGTLYRPDGREEPAPGADPQMTRLFQPRGSHPKWQEAFALVTHKRPDLQALIAPSFGAPLMTFTGETGVVVSAWSRQSGVGKSASLTVSQAIWSKQSVKNSLDDTSNAVFEKVARSRALVCNWDEARVVGDEVPRFVRMVYSLTQGKEKARMRSDTTLRDVGEWETILVMCSNRPMQDHVTAQDEGTEAGSLRVLEWGISQPPTPQTAHAATIIAQARENYGHAGRIYAKWLAQNAAVAEKVVHAIRDDLSTALAAEQGERLYIAGMAAMLAGAKIATKLGICHFDTAALRAFLCDVFLESRSARQRNVVVSSTGYDLQQVLGMYMSENMGRKLITDHFGRQGPHRPAVKWFPRNENLVEIHISQQDRILRINRIAFQDWCRKRNLAAQDVIAEMQRSWGAVIGRRVIGARLGYGGGQLWCIDIPLTFPELENYLYADDAAQQPPAAPPAPAPAAAPGNRPRP